MCISRIVFWVLYCENILMFKVGSESWGLGGGGWNNIYLCVYLFIVKLYIMFYIYVNEC